MTRIQQDGAGFPRLDDQQIEQLGRLAKCVEFADGELLIEHGSRNFPFYVIKSGAVEITEHSGDAPRSIVTHGPGEFTGDVDMLTGRPTFISATARGPVQAIQVEADRLRLILNELPRLSDLLLEAFQIRRRMLEEGDFEGLRVVGSDQCADANLLREFLYKNRVPHTFIDVEAEGTSAWLAERGVTRDQLPAVVCENTVVARPTVAEVAEHIGIHRDVSGERFDLVVVGAGPAGLAAAVYGGSEGLKTLVLDRLGPGGQAGTSSKIENYMGFPSGLSGADLANRGYLQALKFGVQFSAPASVADLVQDEAAGHVVVLETGERIRTGAVLIATGASYRRLDAEGCDRFRDAGVFAAATSVEARVCRDGTAVVIGGGNSAGQAALFLAEHAAKVVMLLRGNDLRKSMSDYLAHRIELEDRVEVWFHSELEGVYGERRVERIGVRHNAGGDARQLECRAVFSFIGARPHTDWVPAAVARDEYGFLLTGGDVEDRSGWELEREPCQLETSVPGLFAAGDVRHGSTKRVAFAVGDGALAVTCVHRAASG